MKLAIISLIIALNTGPCPPAADGRNASMNQEFQIRVGESVSMEKNSLKLTFNEVAEDSRCPENVNCVWAGNGKIVLAVSVRGRTPGKINLNTMLEPKLESVEGYEIKLVKLDPYPKGSTTIKKDQYVATLVVSKK